MTDYERIKTMCAQSSELWEDPDFPAQQASVFYHQTPPFHFVWKRAKDIYANPKFIVDNTEAFDVIPGKLGDNWLVSCLGVLYLNKGLFYRVVPADQRIDSSYCGVFRFRIWWCGQWVEVLVDDRLPTVNGRLAFVQSSNSEQLWPALLEKAYAKLHSSYEALKYGSLLDGLADLTGGITESIPSAELADPAALKALLHKTSIVTAFYHSHSPGNEEKLKGLQAEMNYQICSVDEVETYSGPMAVVRLRRPLAPGETGITHALTDVAIWKSIPLYERERITMVNRGFWVAFSDMQRIFTRIEVVHLDTETSLAEPSLVNKLKWKMEMHQRAWKRGVTAGGCRNYASFFHMNPQIQLHVSEPGTAIVSLNQHSIMEPKVIGFSIYKIPKPLMESASPAYFRQAKSTITSQYTNSRQVSHRCELEVGNYLVIPTTFEPREESSFTLRIFSVKHISSKILDELPKMRKPAVIKAPPGIESVAQYEAVFLQLADEHKTIDIFELQELLDACLPNDYIKSCASIDTCRHIVLCMDKAGTGRISLSDFKDLMCSLKQWQLVFKSHAREKMGVLRAERLKDALREIGFVIPERVMSLLILRYMRKDGMLRFGDFVSAVMHLHRAFEIYYVNENLNSDTMQLNLSDWLKNALMC